LRPLLWWRRVRAASFPNQWHRKLPVFGFRSLTTFRCIEFFLVLQDAAAVIP
jgi:hypothetical protein